jgi:CRISPR-associated protein Csb2
VPLPTVNPRLKRVEGIARALVVAGAEYQREIAWVNAYLGGRDLTWDGEVMAWLDPLPEADAVLRQYIGSSRAWTTVTPVILPGHDDRRAAKTEGLLRKALLHAGLDCDVIDSVERLEWQRTPFRAGAARAERYLRPDKVVGAMVHVRVRFARPVGGPLTVGSGRHRGMGVFAMENWAG